VATRNHHPHRRTADTLGGWIHEHWKTVVVSIAFFYLLLVVTSKVDSNARRLDQQRIGRSIAIDVLCAGTAAAETVNRLVLLNDRDEWANAIGRDRANLLFKGAPPDSPALRRRRELFTSAYVEVFTRETLARAGVNARGVIAGDGTIDCAALQRKARAAGGGR
jgi:hypothetical protein